MYIWCNHVRFSNHTLPDPLQCKPIHAPYHHLPLVLIFTTSTLHVSAGKNLIKHPGLNAIKFYNESIPFQYANRAYLRKLS